MERSSEIIIKGANTFATQLDEKTLYALSNRRVEMLFDRFVWGGILSNSNRELQSGQLIISCNEHYTHLKSELTSLSFIESNRIESNR